MVMLAGVTVWAVAATPPAVSIAEPPAAEAACMYSHYRPTDSARQVTNARGVAGVMRTPSAGEISGYGTDRPSGADIALLGSSNGSNDWVQFGWYIGGVPGKLPYVTQPTVFYGEYDPNSPGDEILRQGTTLSWATYYTFSIWRHVPGGPLDDFYFFLNGTFRTSTVKLHERYNEPIFVGEVEYSCTEMQARGFKNAVPYSTLSYLSDEPGSGPIWYYFDDVRQSDGPFVMDPWPNGTYATGYGHGPI